MGSYVLGTGFILEPEEAQDLIAKDPRNKAVLFPYLNGEDLNSRWDCSASRWVINFNDWPIERAMEYHDIFAIVDEKVRPERQRTNPDGSYTSQAASAALVAVSLTNGPLCVGQSPTSIASS